MNRIAQTIVATAVASSVGGGALAADALKLAIGQRGKWDGAVAELGQRGGIFKKHGLELEILWTSGGGETMQAVISGSVDVGMTAGTLGVLGAFAKGAPIRIISAQATGDDAYWYVRADSPVKSMADMKGRTMAYSTKGSSTNSNVLALIEHFKVEAKPVATGGASPTFTSVMSGQVDAGWSAPPFGIEAIRKGEIRVIVRATDLPAIKNHTVRVNAANLQSLQSKSEVYARFGRAYRETIEWMYSSEEALHIYAEFAQVSVDVARQIRAEFDPKEMVQADQIMGLNDLMAEAVRFKYMGEPLTEAQLKELMQIR
jgi:ABC-type nitrate/sulfonate/bicarbonate transport system substrate-binding protein